ncbi:MULTISPECIES: phage tail assembly chaperone [unclassified Pseudomonas]|uniref:phage tail assembly chaperone n=2 Tax=Pseudomonas TaxID=286 RepID=UPI001E4A9913|nr:MULTISPECIES: phage tail assembly chaperone [unclassified Pseudomonas]UVL18182.1 phage tail assembly chaperone [Pseudomonas sp. B21-044]
MMFFYSAVTGGLYVHDINGTTMPVDVMEISEEKYLALISAAAEGNVLVPDSNGLPLISAPRVNSGALASAEREWRDAQLAATDGLVSRHRDELESGTETTVTSAQYTELQAYRKTLRSWPESGQFPLIEHRPPAPAWLSDGLS